MRRILVVVLIALGIFGWSQAQRYAEAQGLIPIGVTLAGMQLQGETAEGVATILKEAYEQPVAVYFGEERLILRTADIGFQVYVAQMLAEAEQQRTRLNLLLALAGEALGRTLKTTDIPLRYQINSAQVQAWLADVAAKYDRPPRPPQIVASSLTFLPGEEGLRLDIEASAPALVAALATPGDRRADLVLQAQPAPPPTISALNDFFASRRDAFGPDGVVSIYMIDLTTYEEAGYEGEVAFAGMSTMKIPILIETFRALDEPPNAETTRLLTETIDLSGNYTANLLLQIVGEGDMFRGAATLTQSMQRLGLQNTFMVSVYDHQPAVETPRTPANSRTDVTTFPDRYMQTTAKDMALLMQMIYDCAQGKGTLLAAYPTKITPDECVAMIDLLDMNDIDLLIEEGLPPEARIAHKHGFIDDSHADVAIIWGPQGPYVLSIYLYLPVWLEWDLSNGTMQEVARATWSFYEFRSALAKEPVATNDS